MHVEASIIRRRCGHSIVDVASRLSQGTRHRWAICPSRFLSILRGGALAGTAFQAPESDPSADWYELVGDAWSPTRVQVSEQPAADAEAVSFLTLRGITLQGFRSAGYLDGRYARTTSVHRGSPVFSMPTTQNKRVKNRRIKNGKGKEKKRGIDRHE